MAWKQIYVNPYSPFFGMFQKVLRQITNQTHMKIKTSKNEVYKFDIQYQDDNPDISGIDVYKEEPEENIPEKVSKEEPKEEPKENIPEEVSKEEPEENIPEEKEKEVKDVSDESYSWS